MGAGSSTVAGALVTVDGHAQDLRFTILRDSPLGKMLSQTNLLLFSRYFTVLKLGPHMKVGSAYLNDFSACMPN